MAFMDLEYRILSTGIPSDPTELSIWNNNDAKSRGTIDFKLNNNRLDQVRDVTTAAEMWNAILRRI